MSLMDFERRQAPRFDHLADRATVHVRIRPGYEAGLLNVSVSGALVEGPCRLMPGSTVDLQLTGGFERIALRGLVTRCTISRLCAASVWYCGALAFDRPIPWVLAREADESVLCEQVASPGSVRAVPSHVFR